MPETFKEKFIRNLLENRYHIRFGRYQNAATTLEEAGYTELAETFNNLCQNLEEKSSLEDIIKSEILNLVKMNNSVLLSTIDIPHEPIYSYRDIIYDEDAKQLLFVEYPISGKTITTEYDDEKFDLTDFKECVRKDGHANVVYYTENQKSPVFKNVHKIYSRAIERGLGLCVNGFTEEEYHEVLRHKDAQLTLKANNARIIHKAMQVYMSEKINNTDNFAKLEDTFETFKTIIEYEKEAVNKSVIIENADFVEFYNDFTKDMFFMDKDNKDSVVVAAEHYKEFIDSGLKREKWFKAIKTWDSMIDNDDSLTFWIDDEDFFIFYKNYMSAEKKDENDLIIMTHENVNEIYDAATKYAAERVNNRKTAETVVAFHDKVAKMMLRIKTHPDKKYYIHNADFKEFYEAYTNEAKDDTPSYIVCDETNRDVFIKCANLLPTYAKYYDYRNISEARDYRDKILSIISERTNSFTGKLTSCSFTDKRFIRFYKDYRYGEIKGFDSVKRIWKDVVYIANKGVYYEEAPIVGEIISKRSECDVYNIDDYVIAVANKHCVPTEDVYVFSTHKRVASFTERYTSIGIETNPYLAEYIMKKYNFNVSEYGLYINDEHIDGEGAITKAVKQHKDFYVTAQNKDRVQTCLHSYIAHVKETHPAQLVPAAHFSESLSRRIIENDFDDENCNILVTRTDFVKFYNEWCKKNYKKKKRKKDKDHKEGDTNETK